MSVQSAACCHVIGAWSFDQRRNPRQHVGDQVGRYGFDELRAPGFPVQHAGRLHSFAEGALDIADVVAGTSATVATACKTLLFIKFP